MEKIYFIVLDGAADRPISMLQHRTPLQFAQIPFLDTLAHQGQQSLIEILPKGLVPETDSGVMALLGCDPKQYYPGRGTLECMGLGKYQKYQYFVGFRVNFASVNRKSCYLDRRTARDLSDQELKQLTEEIRQKVKLSKYPSVSYELVTFGKHRGILSFYSNETKLSGNVSNTDPGFQKVGMFSIPRSEYENRPERCEPLDQDAASGITAAIVNDFIEQSRRVLETSEINCKRRENHRRIANCLLIRDGGGNPVPLPCFMERYHRRLTVYGQLPCEKAIAGLMGADYKYTKAFEMQHDEEYLKELAGVLVRDESDVVFCHLKGPDEPGHDNDPVKKVQALERIDQCFVHNLMNGCNPDDVFVVTCDHATPCELGIHSDDRVPLLISGASFTSDKVNHFDEQSAETGACKVKRAIDIFDYLYEEKEDE